MIKTSFLDLRAYHTSIRNSVKSKWSVLLILFPVGCFILYRLFENEFVTAAVNFLPWDNEKSAGFYRDLLQLFFSELLWLAAFFALAWAFVVYVPLLKIVDAIETRFLSKSLIYPVMVITASFIASVLVSYFTLRQFPNSSDEYVYLYQAETLAQGKLWQATHDLPNFFSFNNIAQKDGISVGRFPPGWPLILSIAYYSGFPAFLVNPILGLIALIVFYSFARKFYGHRIAMWSLISLALTSFYIFNSGSYFSHTSSLLFTIGFVYCVHRYEEKPAFIYGILAGLCVGMLVITRYYTALVVFIPVALYLLYKLKGRSIIFFLWMGLGSLPCAIFLMWYNYSITGNALMPVTTWAYNDEALGFVHGHSIAKGIEHIARRALMFLYWCSPALLILYFIYLWRKLTSKIERLTHPEDYLLIALIIGYFFYYEIGGNQYGPRFYFEALPFVVLFVVSKTFQLKEKWAVALLCAGLIYAAVKIPFIAKRESRIVAERNDIYQLVKENRLNNAVVFISSFTSVSRPMPVGDLTRNDVYYINDVLYVRDMKQKDRLMMEYYPDRVFYKYVRNKEKVHGRLVRIK